MALSRVKTWNAAETLTASDLNAEFNNICNHFGSLDNDDITSTATFTMGELIVGSGITSADGGQLHVHTATAGSVQAVADADEAVFENSAAAGITILSGASSTGMIAFGDSGDADIGKISYSHSTNGYTVTANAATALQISSAGAVTTGGSVLSDTDSTDSLGSASVRWANLYVDSIGDTGQALAITAGTNAISLTAGDLTLYDDNNNADTSISMGTSAAEALVVQALNGGSNKTLEELRLTTKTASGTADHGKVTVYVDEAHIADVDDSGINLASGKTFRINGTNVVATAGDFSGPGSATDNAVVRFDGTGGKTAQNSGVTIDDSNNVTGFGTLATSGAATLASLVCTAGGTFGGGYGSTGATISTAGVGQFNGALTTDGVFTAASLDISGDADIDGTLEADAITLNGTALGSLYSPIAGSSSIVTTGTVSTGTWEATDVGVAHGGTGLSTVGSDELLTGNGTSALTSESNLTYASSVLKIKRDDTVTTQTLEIEQDGAGDAAMVFNRTGIIGWYLGVDASTHGSNTNNFYISDDASNTGNLFNFTAGGKFLIEKKDEGTSAVGIECHGDTGQLKVISTANQNLYLYRHGSSAGPVAAFYYNHSDVGSIDVASSSTSYNTSSDYRLKDNVTDLSGAVSRIAQLQPRRFNFKSEPSVTRDGFVAHEVSGIVPEAITGAKDATRTISGAVVDADGNVVGEDRTEEQWTAAKEGDDPAFGADTVWHETLTVPVWQGIDQSKLVPLLTAAIQELTARVAALEAA